MKVLMVLEWGENWWVGSLSFEVLGLKFWFDFKEVLEGFQGVEKGQFHLSFLGFLGMGQAWKFLGFWVGLLSG